MRIALAQINTILGAVTENIKKIEKYVNNANEDHCDLIVFPELALSGYSLRDIVKDAGVSIDSAIFNNIKEKSKNIDIVLGYDQDDNGYFYNSALYFSKGDIVHNYKKVHLPDYGMFEESRYFRNGESIDAVDTANGRVSMLICEDMFHLSAQNYVDKLETDILIILSASPFWADNNKIKPEIWKTMCVNFARLSSNFVLFSNRVGFEDGVGFFGNSLCVNPSGSIIKEAGLFKEEMIVADIDLKENRRAKEIMPLKKSAAYYEISE